MCGRFVPVVLVTLLFIFPIAGAQEDNTDWTENEIDPNTWTDGPELEGSPMDIPGSGNPIVELSVRYTPSLAGSEVEGKIIIELFPNWVPITTGNFIMLAEENFWDGIFFHRVIDDFVAQSGDPLCTTLGTYPATSPGCGSGGSGQTIPLEHNENMSHVDGAIGMARGQDQDSAESQFYICDTEQHQLDPEERTDGGYATFGIVRDGMSHVRSIATVPTSNDPFGIGNVPPGPDRPIEEVHLISIRMIGVVASSDETVESNTFGENVEEIGSNVLSILYWIWAFALLGGIGLNLRRGGPISDLGIESAVDAMLELGP
ncbi:MAG: peptidylprolyl isomerase [Candidatus Thermoplasmatota archaeon]|nr:peptidylprolyl isomerase [Candidatus Thermoplasmatota archaeon]